MTTDNNLYGDITPGPSAPAGDPAAKPAADPAKPADAASGAKPADAPADKPNSDPAKKDGDGKDAAQGDKPKDGKDEPKASVEFTDFKLPEGFDMDTELLAKFKPLAQSASLSQEAAQQFMDIHVESMMKVTKDPEFREAVYAAEHAGKLKAWEKQVMDDPEVGGENAPEALSKALAAVEALDKEVPGLAALVKDASIGLGSSLVAVRFFSKLGNRIKASGSFPSGGNGGVEKTAAEIMYPDANQN